MSIVRRVAKNTAFLAVSEIIHKIVFFFLIIYATRILGVEDFGRYSFALAFAFVFSIFADMGISVIMQREIARKKSLAGRYLGSLIIFKMFLIIGLTIFIILLLMLLGYSSEYFLVIIIACLAIFIESASAFFRILFVSFEIMEYDAALKILQVALTAIFGFYVLAKGWGLLAFIAIFLLANIIVLIFSVILARKFTKLEFCIDIELWKSILKKALPLSLAIVFGVIYFRVVTLMLSWIQGDTSVGIYNAAFQIIGALLFFQVIYNKAIIPLLSKLFHESKNAFNRIVRLSMKYILTITLPMVIGITLLSERIISFLYTTEFANSAVPLQIIMWSYFLLFFGTLFYTALIAMDLEKKLMKIMGTGALVNIMLNILLIPMFDYTGAAIATVITQFCMILVYVSVIRKNGVPLKITTEAIKPVIAVIAMALFLIRFSNMNLFLIIPLAAIVYITVFLLVKGLTREDIALIKEVVLKKY